MKLISLMLTLILCTLFSHSQTPPQLSSPLTPGGVRSRNVELLNIIPFKFGSGDQFSVCSVSTVVGSSTVNKQLLVTVDNSDPSEPYIKVLDVTNPRTTPQSGEYLKIVVHSGATDSSQLGGRAGLEFVATYVDEHSSSSGTVGGHTILVAYVNNILYNPTASGRAKYVIIDMTEAVKLRETTDDPEIIISNAYFRYITNDGSLQTTNKRVFLGVIEYNDEFEELLNPHTIGCDQKSGILALPYDDKVNIGSNLRTAIELFNLKNIYDLDVAAGSSSHPFVLPPITMSGGTTPILLDNIVRSNSSEALLTPHDIVPHYLASDKVRLFIGSTGNGDPDEVAGGAYIVDIDYKDSNGDEDNAVIIYSHLWDYDTDRETPWQRYSDDTDWRLRIVHSAVPFYHTNDTDLHVLTTDEMFWTKFNLYQNYNSPSIDLSAGTDGQWVGGVGASILKYNSTDEDDRRIGQFLRVWGTNNDPDEPAIVGHDYVQATDDGPLSLYDPRESTDNDRLYYSSVKEVSGSSMAVQCAANGSKDVGPNTVHRVITVSPFDDSRYTANNNDALVASYSAGLQVVNLTNTASTGEVIEKAFFDFIPTMNYDKNSPYFYKIYNDVSPQMQGKYLALDNIALYFQGSWHVESDFGTSRVDIDGDGTLPGDEKFLYTIGFGEGKIDEDPNHSPDKYLADPSEISPARNWLNSRSSDGVDGGVMALRYFDTHTGLGGTIQGYTGSSSWNNRSYREVNLQGEFDVKRDLTISSGASVFLLPGHTSDPGVVDETALATTSSRTIYVDGTLNISVPEGDVEGTTITIDVPIVVRSGGQLNVYKINSGARVIFKKPVTINSNGSWTMHPDADVELDYEDHICNGKFKILGTSGHRVRFTGRRSSPGITARGSNVVMQRTSARSFPWLTVPIEVTRFQIHHGLCENVYFDMYRPQSPIGLVELQNSDFVGNVTYRKKACMVYVENPRVSGIDTYPPSPSIFDIDSCTFTSPLTSTTSRPYYGAFVSSASRVNVSNSVFTSMNKGLSVVSSRQTFVTSSDFNWCTEGLWVINNFVAACNNTFDDNHTSAVSSANNVAEYRDNIFDNTENGVYSLGGGTYWFRNNDFGDYSFGILGYGSQLYLRDRLPQTMGIDIEFGRNDFNSPNATYGYNGGTAIAVNDINLRRYSQLSVDCGYNDFNEYSTYHVSADGTSPSFDASYNRWDDGTVYQPRLENIGYTGTPLDQQLDPNADCDPVVSYSACSHIPCIGSFVDFNQVDTVNSTLLQAIDSLRLSVELPSLSSTCRKSVMYEFLQAVVQTDSLPLYDTLQSRMNSIATNMAYTPQVRSSALMVKLSAFHFTSQVDSAKVILDTLLSRYPLEADSMQANWLGMIMKAETDTAGKFDSLLIAFGDRATADLARPKGTGGFRKASPRTPSSQGGTLPEVEIVKITPNPTNGASVVTIRSTRQSTLLLSVANSLGESVYQYSGFLTAGITYVELSMPDIGSGTYMLSATAGEARSGAVQLQIRR